MQWTDILLPNDFDAKKNPSEVECWTHETSLMQISGQKP